MERKDLLKRLGALGFPLFEKDETRNANETLANVVESKDPRLWEGFPVVLANSAERGFFDYGSVKQQLKKGSSADCLDSLLAMSLALYRSTGLKFSWDERLYGMLSSGKKAEVADFFRRLKKGEELKVAQHVMSSRRLKSTFNNYFTQAGAGLSGLLSQKEELSMEYALSQVFSPKQKELFLKKLKREKLTKTEKEYFSRVVKKKTLALANTDLHRLARKLLGE